MRNLNSGLRPLLLLMFILTAIPLAYTPSPPLDHGRTGQGLQENLAKFGSGSVALGPQLSPLLLSTQTSTFPAINPGTDITVTDDPIGLPQNEPSVSVNPLNPLNLVVAANDYSQVFFTGNAWLGYYTSTDGGRTWTSHIIPGYPFSGNNTYPLYGYGAASDPTVAFDIEGNAYISGIVFNTSGGQSTAGSVFIAKSFDGGATFPYAKFVNRVAGLFFNDKPYLAIDRSPTSPFKDRLYATWTQFNPNGAQIQESFSQNHGVTWSGARILSNSSQNQGSVTAVGPGGQVYTAWLDLSSNTTRIAKSLDGGLSFSLPQVVRKITPIPSPLPHTSFRTNSLPTMALDETTGVLYIAWNDYHSGNSDILSTRSTNGGASWSNPLKVNDDATSNDQFFPWMAASNGTLSLTFYDRRLDPSNHNIDVFLALSNDGGLSFSPNVRVTDASFNPDLVFNGKFIGDYIGIASAPGTLHPVWTDNRNVNATSYLNQDVFTDVVKVGVYRDVALKQISLSRNFTYANVQAKPLLLQATIANQGTQPENITITVFLNSTSISGGSVLGLLPGSTVNATLEINTTALTRGLYSLSSRIAISGAENVTSNNVLQYNSLQVRITGDVNGDGVVNFLDLGQVGAAFLTNPTSPFWDPHADMNNDSAVNFLDLGIVGSNFLTK